MKLIVGVCCFLFGIWVGGCVAAVAQGAPDSGCPQSPELDMRLPVLALEPVSDGLDSERFGLLTSAARGLEGLAGVGEHCRLFDGPYFVGLHPVGGRVINVSFVPDNWILDNIDHESITEDTVGYYLNNTIKVEEALRNGRMVAILMHELGHALGLKHVEDETLMNPYPANTWRISGQNQEAFEAQCR